MSKVRSAVALVALLALSQMAGAATSLPYTFTNGTVADANQVNANFSALASAIDAKPAGPAEWVQLYDRNYTNKLTATGNLNLSNAGINPDFTTGGFSLTTTTVTNDTLNFPAPGHYLITVQLHASFPFPLTPPAFGSTYQILFNIMDANNQTLGDMVFDGMIPNDPGAILDNTLSTSFVVYNGAAAPKLHIALANFNFNDAFQSSLSVYDIIIVVQKWETPAAP